MGRTKELFMELRQEQENRWKQAEEGFRPLLQVFIEHRKERKEIEELLEQMQQDEAQRMEKITSEITLNDNYYRGVEFKVINGTTYNYKVCPEYQELERQMKALKESLKRRGISAQSGHLTFDEATGEVLLPPEMTPKKPTIQLKFNL